MAEAKDNLILVGLPNWTALKATLRAGNDELGAVDLLKDDQPGITWRAKQPSRGYAWIEQDFGAGAAVPRHGIVLANAPFGRVASPRYRVRTYDSTTAGVHRLVPLATVSQDNTMSTFADVDADPFAPGATRAVPSTTTSPWHLEVSFDHAAALATGTDRQCVYVLLELVTSGGAAPPPAVTIEVKEGAAVRATATDDYAWVGNGGLWCACVRFDAATLTDQTGDGLSVRVTMGATATTYWKLGPIQPLITRDSGSGSPEYDSGWVAFPWQTSTAWAQVGLYELGRPVQESVVHAYIDASTGSLQTLEARYTLLELDYSYSQVLDETKTPILDLEGGVLAEGPALATELMGNGFAPDVVHLSTVRRTPGGNAWHQVRPAYRALDLRVAWPEDPAEWARDVYAVLRRLGPTERMGVLVLPAHADLSQALSFYGFLAQNGYRHQQVLDVDTTLRAEEAI